MKKAFLVVLIFIVNLIVVSSAFADETETFTAQKPDVLLILDGSGSMLFTPTAVTAEMKGFIIFMRQSFTEILTVIMLPLEVIIQLIRTGIPTVGKLQLPGEPLLKSLMIRKPNRKSEWDLWALLVVRHTATEVRGKCDCIPGTGGAYNWIRLRTATIFKMHISDTYTDGSTNNIFESIKTKLILLRLPVARRFSVH